MADSSPLDLRARLKGLLEAPLSNTDLVRELVDLAEDTPRDFRALADVWAMPLYQRDLSFFETFLLRYLPPEPSPLLDQLLEAAERDENDTFFERIYTWVTYKDQTRWNADVLALAASSKSDDEVWKAISRRGRYYGDKTNDEAITALFRRNPARFKEFVERALPYNAHDTFPQIYAAVAELMPNSDLHRSVFQRLAPHADWVNKVRELLATSTKSKHFMAVVLTWQPHGSTELPADLGEAILMKFGVNVRDFVTQHVPALNATLAGELFSPERMKALSDQELFEYLSKVQTGIGAMTFRTNAERWAILLYERNTPECDQYLTRHLRYGGNFKTTVLTLLRRAKADKRYALYKALFPYQLPEEAWNQELEEAAKAPLSDADFLAELDRLDGGYFQLDDFTATALYARYPGALWTFMIKRINPSKIYARLLELVRGRDPNGDYPRLYRRVSRGEDWGIQIQHLLEQDIPADKIGEELNRWHPASLSGADPKLLKPLLDKYGEAMIPYLERAVDWVSKERIAALLNLDIPRGDLLRELAAIASRQPNEFAEMARIWAPKLYSMSPDFFGAFLVRYLDARQEYVIRELLPRIEAEGRVQLFRDLYARAVREDAWHNELQMLMKKTASDDELERLLTWRDVAAYNLDDETATVLYSRNPDRFREFVTKHVQMRRRWWRYDQETFPGLQAAAEKRGDQAVVEHLERGEDASAQWKRAVERLVKHPLPAEQALQRLETLQTPNSWEVRKSTALIDLVETYGMPVMPYVMKHLTLTENYKKLLDAIQRLGDDYLYWRAVFQIGASNDWIKVVKELAERDLPAETFFAELLPLSPGSQAVNRRWSLSAEVATTIYRRYGAQARPFLEQFCQNVNRDLFNAVVQAGDEEYLDYLTYRLIHTVYAVRSNQHMSKDIRTEVDKLVAAATDRLDRLVAESPEKYVRHAANVLSRFRAFAITRWQDIRQNNPVYDYLATKHHEAWLRSPGSITDLLETPEIHVELIGLDILSKGGPDAAARVVENLPLLRAMLLGNMRKSTKLTILKCLEQTALQHPENAPVIMQAIEPVMDYRAQEAIPDDVMLAFVRIQRSLVVAH